MKLLIKLGGTLLDEPASCGAIAAQLRDLVRRHPQTIVVHGGGRQMTRFLADRGVESRFQNGLRVSTPEVMDAVLKVFAGTVNKELVSVLISAGLRAVGLSGIDGALAQAEPLSPELGAVGRIVRTDPSVLIALIGAGFLPVVACVAGDAKGAVYNVNADQMAVACAAGFSVERLLFLTDVDGVRDAAGSVIPMLTAEAARSLIASGVATGGMLAKLESARAALEQGVDEVVIAPGSLPRVLEMLVAGEPIGTRFVLKGDGR
jgi:acetylglutamate kinase